MMINFKPDDSIAAFEEHLANSPATARPWTITPDLAKRMLEMNIGNRAPVERRHDYAKWMKEGAWGLTGSTIVFADDGTLLDGQNRLMACVEAGVPFQSYVVFGVSRSTFAMIDRGKMRGPRDALSIMGVKNNTHVASALRWIILLKTKRVKTRESFEPTQIAAAYEQSDKHLLDEAVSYAVKLYAAFPSDRFPHGSVASIYYLFHQVNPTLAGEFFEHLIRGQWVGRFAAIEKAVRKMREEKLRAKGRLHDVERMFYFVTAWNLCSNKKAGTMPAFEWTQEAPFPAIEGAR